MKKDKAQTEAKPLTAVEMQRGVMSVPVDRRPDDTPIVDRPVLAIVQHWYTKCKRFAVLKSVNEDDHNWQTVDDGSELSHDWDVIAWDFLPELEKT